MKAKTTFFFLIFMLFSIVIVAQPGGGHHPTQPWSYPAKAVTSKLKLPQVPFFDATQNFQQSPTNPYLWLTVGFPYVTAYNTDERVWTMESVNYNAEYRFDVTVEGKDGVKTTYDKVTKVTILYNIYGTITKVQIKYIVVDNVTNTFEEVGNFTHLNPIRITIK